MYCFYGLICHVQFQEFRNCTFGKYLQKYNYLNQEDGRIPLINIFLKMKVWSQI